MLVYGDYHTHSKFSDGHNSIEENVKCAVDKGLKEIAITEHGVAHMACGIRRKDIPIISKEVERMNKKYKDINVLMGIEANLVSTEGDIDITKEERDFFEVVLLGYHKSFKPKNFKQFFTFWLPNFVSFLFSRSRRIKRNTQAYVSAIKKNDIDIIAHLHAANCRVDCVEIAKVAKEHGVYIELSQKHLKFSDKEMLDMVTTGVQFILNTDSHFCERVGLNSKTLALIERLNIPEEQIANLGKKPAFRHRREK